MVQLGKHKIMKIAFQAFMIVILVFLINACSSQPNGNHQSPPQKSGSLQVKPPANWKLPISIPEGEFFKTGGWLSDQEIVYITNSGQTSSLYSYNLFSGKSKLIYKSSYPIGSVKISPSQKNILIQSVPSTYEGKITIVDLHGNEEYSQVIPSYELAIEWNPYQESQVLVTKFKEDWTFTVLLMDFEHKKTEELSLPQPFLKWSGKDRLVYLNWDQNQQKLFAPLVTKSLADRTEKIIFPSVYQFSTFKNMIMTITMNKKEETKADYSFYDQKLNLAYSFTIPQLTKFSDWLVPFYDFNEKQQKFITFRPLRSTEADTYNDGFQLTSYDLENGKGTVLLTGLENEPVVLSPSGNASLYGNRFEKIIDFKTKKIKDLVRE